MHKQWEGAKLLLRDAQGPAHCEASTTQMALEKMIVWAYALLLISAWRKCGESLMATGACSPRAGWWAEPVR